MNQLLIIIIACLISPEVSARGRRGIPIQHNKRVVKKKVYKSVGRCLDPATKKWANGACP